MRDGFAGLFRLSKKKEDRPCGGVGLLLRRKEIRVVLLSFCQSNKRASNYFFCLFLIFAGFMGNSRGWASEQKERRSTKN